MKVFSVGLRGESNCQAAIQRMKRGEQVWLEPEPENEFDARAIRVVDCDDNRLGYVPRGSWLTRLMLDDGVTPRAKIKEITGGRRGAPTRGVVIEVTWDPESGAAAAGSGEKASASGAGCFSILLLALPLLALGLAE